MRNAFNIRVYGIFLLEENVLVTDEYRFETCITKFPGGGLQFGEGTVDGVLREMKEETGTDFEVISHFYTTDFFQRSAFNDAQQIISIYYLIQNKEPLKIQTKETPFDFDQKKEGAQIFRWIPLAALKKEDFTFPIDQHVAALLCANNCK